MLSQRIPDSYIIQEGVSIGNILGLPIYTDSSDDSNTYIGYCKINDNLDKEETCLICKIHLNNNTTTKYFAFGKWEDRETLIYK